MPAPSIWPARKTRFWFSTPEVYREGVTNGRMLRTQLNGRYFLLRSDHPVLFFVDGEQIGPIGAGFESHFIVDLGVDSEHQFDITFPLGFGGAATPSAYVGNEMHHGVGCIETAFDRAMLRPPNPDELPCVQQLRLFAVPAGTAAGQWATVTITPGVAEFSIGGSLGTIMPPQEFWIKHVTLNAEEASTAPPAAGVYPYEIQITKNVSLVGPDSIELFVVNQVVHAATHEVPNFKIPWRSHMQAWGIEVPTVFFRTFGTAWAAGGNNYTRLGFAYTI